MRVWNMKDEEASLVVRSAKKVRGKGAYRVAEVRGRPAISIF